MEKTLAIIKPDGVARGLIGEVIRRLEKEGLTVLAIKMIWMTKKQAQGFYTVHKERPFFDSLTEFMTSGPVMVQVLEGEGAVTLNRELMGATNPAEAAAGTLRADFAHSIDANAVHGSDSPDSAAREVSYFFTADEICS